MILCYDALDAGLIPLDPAHMPPLGTVAVASYCDGDYAKGWRDCCARFPTLARIGWVMSVATRTTSIARVMDIEPGNPTKPQQLPGWIIDMLNHGVYLPMGYADESDMEAVMFYLKANPHLKRSDYGLWLANPTGKIHADPGFEMTQSPFEGNFDISDCEPVAFPAIKQPKPAPTKHEPNVHGTLRAELELTAPGGIWQIKGIDGDITALGTDSKNWSALVTVGNRELHWAVDSMPFDSKPQPPEPK